MASPAAVPLVVVGAAMAVWPYELSLWQERWDSVGSTRDWSDVEPAEWRVTLTRAGGLLAMLGGVAAGVFRDVDPEATATLLIAVPDSAGFTQHTLGHEDVVDRLRTALNELVFDSLLAADADVERGELL